MQNHRKIQIAYKKIADNFYERQIGRNSNKSNQTYKKKIADNFCERQIERNSK